MRFPHGFWFGHTISLPEISASPVLSRLATTPWRRRTSSHWMTPIEDADEDEEDSALDSEDEEE